MSSPKFVIGPGEKFGLIAIPINSIDSALPAEIYLDDIFILRSLPVETIGEFWEKEMGGFRIRQLNESNLFIGAKKVSNEPAVLDKENIDLLEKAEHFYYGLLLSVPFISHGRAMSIKGANIGSGADIREIGQMERIPYKLGTPRKEINMTYLKMAGLIAKSIPEKNEYERLWRIFSAFVDALLSPYVSSSIHQHVRCIEGIIMPAIGESKNRFKSRTQLFVGPKHHCKMDKLYDIRSDVEHLHDPLKHIKSDSERERRLELFKTEMMIESIARYCLHRIYTKNELQKWFKNDNYISDFWKLGEEERSHIWGEPLDLASVMSTFNDEFIENSDLGL